MKKEFHIKEFIKTVIVVFLYLMASLLTAIACVYLVSFVYPLNLNTAGSMNIAFAIMALYFIADFGLLYLKKPFLTIVIIALILGACTAVYKLFFDNDLPTIGREAPDKLSTYVFWKKVFC